MTTHFQAHGQEQFPTTRWSVVDRARYGEGPTARDALDKLLRRYLPALRAHLVITRGMDGDAADEVLQSFCVEKVLEGAVLEHADAARGKFRTFLLCVLNHYVTDQYRRSAAKFRSPGAAPVSIEEHDIAAGMAGGPPAAYEVAWARQVVDAAVQRMEEECRKERPEVWGVFEGRLLRPLFEQTDPTPYDVLVKQFGFRSPSQAANALVTAKRVFIRALRSVVGEYAAAQTDIDEEIASLLQSLSLDGA